MRRYSNPTEADQQEFSLELYFGREGTILRRIVRRAYLDFSRTIHQIGACPVATSTAEDALLGSLTSLAMSSQAWTVEQFDNWHEATCSQLISCYRFSGYEAFTVGQAQKWINMALKYVYVFGESRVPGYAHLYMHCHVPIDNVILRSPVFKPYASFKTSWSRIMDYPSYLAFQKAVREHVAPSAPLAAEFWEWRRGAA